MVQFDNKSNSIYCSLVSSDSCDPQVNTGKQTLRDTIMILHSFWIFLDCQVAQLTRALQNQPCTAVMKPCPSSLVRLHLLVYSANLQFLLIPMAQNTCQENAVWILPPIQSYLVTKWVHQCIIHLSWLFQKLPTAHINAYPLSTIPNWWVLQGLTRHASIE